VGKDDRLRFAELITYREIIGEEPILAGLHAILEKYQRREVLFLSAKLNCLLGAWENASKFDLDMRFCTTRFPKQKGPATDVVFNPVTGRLELVRA
jgi:hypothetical protein